MQTSKYKTGRLLVQLGNAVSWYRNQNMQQVGLTSSQSEVIKFILRNSDKQLTAGDIMAQINLSQSTVAGILKRLEKKSMLIRRTDKDDARKSTIELTEKGQAMKGILKNVAAQTEEILLKGMSDNEQAEFNRLLQIALQNMNEMRTMISQENKIIGGKNK